MPALVGDDRVGEMGRVLGVPMDGTPASLRLRTAMEVALRPMVAQRWQEGAVDRTVAPELVEFLRSREAPVSIWREFGTVVAFGAMPRVEHDAVAVCFDKNTPSSETFAATDRGRMWSFDFGPMEGLASTATAPCLTEWWPGARSASTRAATTVEAFLAGRRVTRVWHVRVRIALGDFLFFFYELRGLLREWSSKNYDLRRCNCQMCSAAIMTHFLDNDLSRAVVDHAVIA
jgi:hypothetical protein